MTGELTLIVSLSFALGSGFAALHVPDAIERLPEAMNFDDSRFTVLLFLMALANRHEHVSRSVDAGADHPAHADAYDIDLVHFGVLMVMAVVIRQLTPPLAIALIITSRIAGVDQMRIFRANLPFFLAILAFTLALMAARYRDLAAVADAVNVL